MASVTKDVISATVRATGADERQGSVVAGSGAGAWKDAVGGVECGEEGVMVARGRVGHGGVAVCAAVERVWEGDGRERVGAREQRWLWW